MPLAHLTVNISASVSFKTQFIIAFPRSFPIDSSTGESKQVTYITFGFCDFEYLIISSFLRVKKQTLSEI